jgi:predicted transcriptional regulator
MKSPKRGRKEVIKLPKYPNLAARMAQNGITQNALAGLLKITPQSLCYKLRGKRGFSQDEINKIIELFNSNYEEIFLTQNSA